MVHKSQHPCSFWKNEPWKTNELITFQQRWLVKYVTPVVVLVVAISLEVVLAVEARARVVIFALVSVRAQILIQGLIGMSSSM